MQERPRQEHALSFVLDRHPEDLVRFRDRLRGWLTDVGVALEAREDVVLACWEAAANGLEHPLRADGAPAEIEVVVTKDDDRVRVSVADAGGWRVREEPREGRGLGLRLIDALMDRVEIDRTQNGTRVLMCRRLDHSW